MNAALKVYGKVWPISAYFYRIGEAEGIDFTAPEAPTSVTVDSTTTSAIVNWAGSDADTKAFYIYVNGVKKAEVKVARTAVMQAEITGLEAGEAYQVYVTAVDHSGNESLRSRTVEVITRVQ